jgi:hypothetical protein
MVTGTLAALLSLVAPTQAEQQFWRWFVTNSPRVRSIRSGHEPIAGELAAQLTKVHRDLTWEVGPPAAERELVISAAGLKEAFPAVKSLVAAKPPLPGWKIIAFRPRRTPSLTVQYGSYELDPASVWFRAEPDGGKVGLTVFVQGYVEDDQAAGQAVFLLLDNALGEYDVETRVGFIQIKPLAPEPAKKGLRPFLELPAAVDQLDKTR